MLHILIALVLDDDTDGEASEGGVSSCDRRLHPGKKAGGDDLEETPPVRPLSGEGEGEENTLAALATAEEGVPAVDGSDNAMAGGSDSLGAGGGDRARVALLGEYAEEFLVSEGEDKGRGWGKYSRQGGGEEGIVWSWWRLLGAGS